MAYCVRHLLSHSLCLVTVPVIESPGPCCQALTPISSGLVEVTHGRLYLSSETWPDPNAGAHYVSEEMFSFPNSTDQSWMLLQTRDVPFGGPATRMAVLPVLSPFDHPVFPSFLPSK